MKKRYTLFFLLLCILVLFGCRKTRDVYELSVNKIPEAYYEVNEDIDASQFTVDLKVNDKVQTLPITDTRFNVTGLVNGKLPTTSVGEKTVVISYETVSVTMKYYVADKLVRTYNEFINALSETEGLIVLMDDVQVTTSDKGVTIPAGQEKILELNGHVISFETDYSGSTALITNKGKLTIRDNTDVNQSGTGSGGITNNALNPDTEWDPNDPADPYPSYATNTITNMGTLIIESGLIENTTTGGASYAVDNNSTESDSVLVVKGGKIVGRVNFAVRMYANSTTNTNVVNVQGGVIEGVRAIWLQLPGSSGQEKLAEIKVSGGTLKSTDNDYNLAIYSYTFGDSFAKTKITITGGTFEGDVGLTGGTKKVPTETVSVSGGYFKGNYGVYSYEKTMEPFITGGTFKSDPTDYVDLDTYEVKNVNGEYVVSKKSA